MAGTDLITTGRLPLDAQHLLTWLTRLTSTDPAAPALPERLCRACVAFASGDGGALTLEYAAPERVTLVTTDAVAAHLEDLQEVLGEGPCWDAAELDEAVSTVLGDEPRWPTFTAAAQDGVGPLWICALPLRAGTELIGVLSIHRAVGRASGARPWTAPDLTDLQFLADIVGAALHRSPEEDLLERLPWEARASIHQAVGTVVAQIGVPVEDAMALLRAHAFTSGQTLGEVADRVLRGGLAFDAPEVKEGEK